MQLQPRSGGGEVSPGRKPRVKWKIDRSRVAAAEVLSHGEIKIPPAQRP